MSVPFPNPKIAVDVFMVLSGFLMSYTVSARESREPMDSPRNWIAFYLRRYFRLAPAYYLSLAAAILFSAYYLVGYADLRAMNASFWQYDRIYDPMRTQYTLGNIVLHISFLFGLFPTYSFSSCLPDWSLSLEMQFYVAFPMIYLAMKRFGPARAAVFLALVCYLTAWQIHAAAAAGKITAFYEPSLLIFKLPMFLVGMLIFEATKASKARYVYATLALAICLKTADIYGIQVLWLAIPAALLLATVMPASMHSRFIERLNRLCRTKAVTTMSDLSYSVYLFHGFAISIVGSKIIRASVEAEFSRSVAVVVMWIAVMLISTAIAWVIFHAVEKPGIRLGAVLGRRGKRESRPASI